MSYPSAPRIEWSPDGLHLLTVVRGAIRIAAVDGSPVRTIAEAGWLDARWLADGQIVAVDLNADPDHFTIEGGRDRGPPKPRVIGYTAAELSSTGSEFVAIDQHGTLTVRSVVERDADWLFSHWDHGVQPEPGRLSAALSNDGQVVAIGYETRAWDDGSNRRESGRGWLAIDVSSRPSRARRAGREGVRAGVLDRTWYPCIRDEGPLRFAFAAGPRRRIAIAAPERDADVGVIRIGAGDAYPRKQLGGSRAVALDNRGIIAAYAYPPGIGDRRLRVDYLAPQPKGPSVVEVLDRLWIDPDLDDIVALAFDLQSRRIACLGADGAVEVVPVP